MNVSSALKIIRGSEIRRRYVRHLVECEWNHIPAAAERQLDLSQLDQRRFAGRSFRGIDRGVGSRRSESLITAVLPRCCRSAVMFDRTGQESPGCTSDTESSILRALHLTRPKISDGERQSK